MLRSAAPLLGLFSANRVDLSDRHVDHRCIVDVTRETHSTLLALGRTLVNACLLYLAALATY